MATNANEPRAGAGGAPKHPDNESTGPRDDDSNERPMTPPRPGQGELEPPLTEGNRPKRPVTSPGISDAPPPDEKTRGSRGDREPKDAGEKTTPIVSGYDESHQEI